MFSLGTFQGLPAWFSKLTKLLSVSLIACLPFKTRILAGILSNMAHWLAAV